MILLYIDPGTGSMLFSLAIGLISVLWFGLRKLYLKVRYLTPKKKSDKEKKDLVIYGEDKRYWTNFREIVDELERRKIRTTYLAGSEDDPILQDKYEYIDTEVIGLGNKAYTRLNFLNARVVLATTPSLDVYQWKRSKEVDYYVHMTHSLGGSAGYRMFSTQFFDAVLLSSDVFIPVERELEEKRNSKPKEICAVGQTYMDFLGDRKKKELKASTQEHKRVTVLLAPSWGQTGLLNRFGDQLVDILIETGYDITVRPHPQSFISEKERMDQLQEKYPESEHFHWNRDTDNFNVLSESDILISDFSGVVYDYAFTFERPVIYASAEPDTPVMDQAWLDEPYWGTAVLPRIGMELKEDELPSLKKLIDEMVHNEKYVESIRDVRDEYWQNQGHASEAVVDFLVSKCEELKSADETGKQGELKERKDA